MNCFKVSLLLTLFLFHIGEFWTTNAAVLHADENKTQFRDSHYKDGQHDEHFDHQSILGSKKTAESFDKMSPDESKRRLRVLATKMDVDHDGFVDRQELADWILNSLRSLDQEESDERFDEVDENHDQFVTWTEYKNDAFGLEEEDGNDEEDDKLMEEDFRYFQAADKNGDGKLTKEEFAAFQNPENHQHMHFSLVENTLKEKDKNNDGYIDIDEYLASYASKKDSEWYAVEKSRFVEEYDKNGDGKLDRSEIQGWLVPDSVETAKEEVDHLFAQADHNKDGKLSYKEIELEYNLFVGSEATNYGEQLENIEHDEL